jgi:hypothetical protein
MDALASGRVIEAWKAAYERKPALSRERAAAHVTA